MAPVAIIYRTWRRWLSRRGPSHTVPFLPPQQARAFKEVAEIGGIILTKLDGTAKGGIALAIRQELEVPVWYIGVGEGIDDLQPFSAKDFVEALF